MNIETIDELLGELTKAKAEYGGDAEVFLKDPDTGWHMQLSGFRKSNNEPKHVLLIAEDHSDYLAKEAVV